MRLVGRGKRLDNNEKGCLWAIKVRARVLKKTLPPFYQITGFGSTYFRIIKWSALRCSGSEGRCSGRITEMVWRMCKTNTNINYRRAEECPQIASIFLCSVCNRNRYGMQLFANGCNQESERLDRFQNANSSTAEKRSQKWPVLPCCRSHFWPGC